ncbi:MAG TPA: hypothetical protein VHY22_12495, partial [Chthoniobacteraceae bacterium]|nr:hypothetical protein [Chthoniobacteraceae bacterium]
MNIVLPRLLPVLAAAVCILAGCKTTADRFSLYQPDRPQGPAIDKLRGMTLAGRFNHQSATYTYPVSAAQPPQEPATETTPPPPPPPSTGPGVTAPESTLGAPAPTPMPNGAVIPPSTQTPAVPPATPPATAPADQNSIPGLSAPTTTTPPPAAATPPAT